LLVSGRMVKLVSTLFVIYSLEGSNLDLSILEEKRIWTTTESVFTL